MFRTKVLHVRGGGETYVMCVGVCVWRVTSCVWGGGWSWVTGLWREGRDRVVLVRLRRQSGPHKSLSVGNTVKNAVQEP